MDWVDVVDRRSSRVLDQHVDWIVGIHLDAGATTWRTSIVLTDALGDVFIHHPCNPLIAPYTFQQLNVTGLVFTDFIYLGANQHLRSPNKQSCKGGRFLHPLKDVFSDRVDEHGVQRIQLTEETRTNPSPVKDRAVDVLRFKHRTAVVPDGILGQIKAVED